MTVKAKSPSSGSLNRRSQARKQRLQAGVHQRERLSRTKLRDICHEKLRRDPLEVLLASAKDRDPALLPIKYARMSASPFAFFRGAAPVMASDLACQAHTGIYVQLCGDAHIQNMGCFAAPNGSLVFDLNDFDETIPGPWEWDVKRMATSIMLAGREAGRGTKSCETAVETFIDRYIASIEELADQPILMAARHQIHRMDKVSPISEALQQAERARPLELLKKYTEGGANGKPRFKTIQNTLWRIHGKERQEVLNSLSHYRESLHPANLHFFSFFEPVDIGFKVVGTGSVGLRDYVILLVGNGTTDPLFLQIKQQVHSVYAPYVEHAACPHQGRRVVEGQLRLQPLSDLLLGWTRIGNGDYLVRQLNDHKSSIDIGSLKSTDLEDLASTAGEILARGHARSGDPLMIKGYIGNGTKVWKALVYYAVRYADLTERDFHLFRKAVKEGRIKVASV